MINRLIRGAIQTGFLVSLVALADLFSFLLHRNTYLYAMFTYPLGCIYTTVRLFSSPIWYCSQLMHYLS